MSSMTFHPGSLVHSGQNLQTGTPARLQLGKKVVPLRILERYWAGDGSALTDWPTENSAHRIFGGDHGQHP